MFGPLGPVAGGPALAQRQFNNLTQALHLEMRHKRLLEVSPDISQDTTAAIPPALLVTEVPAPPHTDPPAAGQAPGLREAQPSAPVPHPLLGGAEWKIRDRTDRPSRIYLRERAPPPPPPGPLPPGDTAGGWRRSRPAAPARGRGPQLARALSAGAGR